MHREPCIEQDPGDRHAGAATEIEDGAARREASGPFANHGRADLRLRAASDEPARVGLIPPRGVAHRCIAG